MERQYRPESGSGKTKLTKATFLNSAVILILANYISQGKEIQTSIWKSTGIANDAWFILLFNIITPPISTILNPL